VDRQARVGVALGTFALALAVLFASDGDARARPRSTPSVVLSEVMVNPTGSEYAREYVELYNRGASPVNLDGWTVGDSLDMDAIIEVASGLVLAPGRYALVLDPTYFTKDEPYLGIPPEALIVTIEDAAFGRNGLVNSRESAVILRSPEGAEQRMTYTPADVVPGYSLEKIDLDGGDELSNWAISFVAEGTPGRENSRRLPDLDAALVAVMATPDTVHPPGAVTIRASIANAGRTALADAELVLFEDSDGDSSFSSGDAVLVRGRLPVLSRGEQRDLTGVWEVLTTPAAPVWVAILAERDQQPANNARPVQVAVGVPSGALRISEIMADPGPAEGQWVEIANVGAARVVLAGCKLATPSRALPVGSPAPTLAPGDFLVLAEYPDSLRLRYGFMVPACGLDGGFPHLSKSADANRSVWLADATGRAADRAAYPVPEAGRSLELVAWERAGDDPTAWQTVWGQLHATPGMANQGMIPPAESMTLTLGPTPPADTLGIALAFPEASVHLTLRVYDMAGREVRRLVDGEQWPAHSTLRWDGLDSGGRPAPTGMYVLLLEAAGTETGRTYRLVRPVVIARRR